MRVLPYPYQSLQAVLGGQTDLNAAVSTTALPMLKAGRLRALVIVGEKRSSLFPDVPTYAEAGYPGIRGDSWIGMFAPAGTPKPILLKLHNEIQKIMVLPDTASCWRRRWTRWSRVRTSSTGSSGTSCAILRTWRRRSG